LSNPLPSDPCRDVNVKRSFHRTVDHSVERSTIHLYDDGKGEALYC